MQSSHVIEFYHPGLDRWIRIENSSGETAICLGSADISDGQKRCLARHLAAEGFLSEGEPELENAAPPRRVIRWVVDADRFHWRRSLAGLRHRPRFLHAALLLFILLAPFFVAGRLARTEARPVISPSRHHRSGRAGL